MLNRLGRWLAVGVAFTVGVLAIVSGLGDVSAAAPRARIAATPPPDLTGLWQPRADKISPPWQLTTSNGGQTLSASWSGGDGHTGLRGTFTGTLDQSGTTNVYRGTLHIIEGSLDVTGTMSFDITSANEFLLTYQQTNGPHGETLAFDRIPPPVFASRVTANPASGQVLVELPGTKKFVDLAKVQSLPVGSIIDTRKGRVLLTTSDGHGGFQTSSFFSGQFKITQPKGLNGLVQLKLVGGNFKSCPGAARAAGKPKTIRKLWGEGAGKFRTVGRFGSATIRGTTWLTTDRCDGTQFRVTVGSITVRDFVKKRNVVVVAPGSYFVPAR